MGLAQHTSRLGVGERTERDRQRARDRHEAKRLWALIDAQIADALAEEVPSSSADQEADHAAPQPLLR